MRIAARLNHEREAQRFQDYLLTRGIKTMIEPIDDQWAVWVYDEDQIEQARQELELFQQNPQREVYQEASELAAQIRKQQAQQQATLDKNMIDVRQRWERPLLSRCPITFGLIIISVLVAFLTNMGHDQNGSLIGELQISESAQRLQPLMPGQPEFLPEVQQGEIWRLFTPMFLHFGILHIVFNMLWLRELGAVIESRKGRLKLVLLVLALAGLSNVAQYLYSGPNFGGMSGVIYGLFGYIWMKGRFDPRSGMSMPPNIVFWMIAFFFLCLSGLMGDNIANVAHGAGLICGIAFGYLPLLFPTRQ